MPNGTFMFKILELTRRVYLRLQIAAVPLAELLPTFYLPSTKAYDLAAMLQIQFLNQKRQYEYKSTA